VGVSLWSLVRRPHRAAAWWRELRSHDRLVLLMTGALLAVGAVLILALEGGRSLAHLPWTERIAAALFQSVSLRTAGFNTVSIGALAPATATVMMFWMFIGGSPGGTAGGVKTTTIGILALSLRSLTRSREDVELFGRRVGEATLLKAIAITLLGGLLVIMGTILLLVVQDGATYTDVLFEVVSAFGTVGLSRGLTPSLTAAGQLLIIALMFVGRTGPLTLAFALGRRRPRSFYRYPEGRILVG
jgi:trk system potassium uptake protein TrkH